MKVLKVVTSAELEQETQRGWQLIATHTEARRIEKSRKPRENGMYGDIVEFQIADQVIFVLEKDSEAATREEALQGRLSFVETERDKAERALMEADEKTKRLQSALDETEKKRQAACDRYREETDRLLSATTRARTLEIDIGKIRVAIGDIRMREILDGK